MLGVFSDRTGELSIRGESARVATPAAEVCFKGDFYLGPQEQARVLNEVLSAGMSVDRARALPGQFVIVIHDKASRKLTFVRDHIGQQPLYFRVEDGRLLFASSVRELRSASGTSWSLDPRGFQDFVAIKYTIPTTTLIKGLSEQTPGTIVEFSGGALQTERAFFDRTPHTPLADRNGDGKWVERFKAEFESSCAAACSDAGSRRFGVLSSGGIDSSMLVGAYRKLTQDRFPTFYIGCDGYKNDRTREAEFVSRLFDTDHRNFYINGTEFADRLEAAVELNDFPVSTPSTILRNHLYANLSGEVDVLLSGEGADCLYTGYYVYDLVYRLYSTSRARPLLGALARLLPLSLIPGDRGRKARLVRQAMIRPPHEYFLQHDTMIGNNSGQLSRMLEGFDESGYLPDFKRLLSGYDRVDILNRILRIYQSAFLSENLSALAKMDGRYGLQHRHPFIHGPMIDAFNQISWGRKVGGFRRKRLIVEMAKEYLPPSFFAMPKEGFGVPIPEWFRDASSLGRYIDLINSRAFRERGLFRKAYVDGLLSDYRNDRLEEGSYEQVLWLMVNFELWARRYLDGQ